MASSDHTVGFEPADRLAQDRESVRRRFWIKFKQVVAQLPFAEDLLAAYNWGPKTERYRKLALFVDAFFTKFPTFQNPPFHPKWKEVSLSAPLPDWQRLPVAEQWLKSHNVEAVSRAKFDEFLKQSPATAANVKTDADRESLFRQFQAWEAERGARAQAPHPPAQR